MREPAVPETLARLLFDFLRIPVLSLPAQGQGLHNQLLRRKDETKKGLAVGTMIHDIHPLNRLDIPELGRFLKQGFQAPDDAPFAASDVLDWKYFDPRSSDDPEAADLASSSRSLIARHPETGLIVGHLGVTTTRFHGGGLAEPGLPSLHMIDWLSSGEGKGVGASLMRRAHRACSMQYGFGGSDIGRLVGDRGGYDLAAMVPVYLNVLRPLHRLKTPGLNLPGRWLRVTNDLGRKLRKVSKGETVQLERVDQFGPEILPCLDAYRTEAVFTSRDPALLNHLLRYPRKALTGFRIFAKGQLRGFGILTVLPRPGGISEGRIVDCLLDDPTETRLWRGAIQALTRELREQEADTALAFGSNEWTGRALEGSGYVLASPLEFRLRDRRKEVPRESSFHLTPIEADYAYT